MPQNRERCRRCGYHLDTGIHGLEFDYYLKIIARLRKEIVDTEDDACAAAHNRAISRMIGETRFCEEG